MPPQRMLQRTIIRTPIETVTRSIAVAISSAAALVVKIETERMGMTAATHSKIPMVSWVL